MKSLVVFIFFLLITIIHLSPISAQVVSVQKISLTVNQLERSIPFYTKVLGFHIISQATMDAGKTTSLYGLQGDSTTSRYALLQLGDEQIELIQFEHTAEARQIPPDSKSNDLWFQHIAIVVADMDKAFEILEEHHVGFISTAPQTLPMSLPNAAGISAFYFQDPDYHALELIHFPGDKGKAKWHDLSSTYMKNKNASPFLGIDHTAIAVDQTEESYGFWQNTLGFKIGGHSLNSGTEQEHLNQVFGARVYITGMVAKEGVGVEFLDYIAPPGGRPAPEHSNATDLWHWHTTLLVDDIDEILSSIKDPKVRVSSSLTMLDKDNLGFMIHDPDGHNVLLIEKNQKPPTADRKSVV